MHTEGIARLAAHPDTKTVDILAAYRVGEIRRVLDKFREQEDRQLRACFANMWDAALVQTYQRKYHDRDAEYIKNAVKDSIQHLIGKCDINDGGGAVRALNVTGAPRARYEIRLTSQRITYSFYRIDNAIFIVPLDMKRAQNPAPLAWLITQQTAPQTFAHYRQEFDRMFDEAIRVYP
jgi:hypothetical protein